jgi:hypothetical protein
VIVCSLLVNFAIILLLLPESAQNRIILGGQIQQEVCMHTSSFYLIKMQQEIAFPKFTFITRYIRFSIVSMDGIYMLSC